MWVISANGSMTTSTQTTSTQWQLAREAAERYEHILVPAILGPAARALVHWAALQPGETVLDVGCGTGAAARFAAEQVGASGRIIGLDVNAGMLDVATSLPPANGAVVEWHEASAYTLPLADETIDAVLCAQTLQFLIDRRRALFEMHRVVKPGGRLALSLWDDLRESPYFDVLVRAVTRHIGPDTAAGLRAAFDLSDNNTIRDLLVEAGWTCTVMTVRRLALDLPPLNAFVPLHISATPMAAGFNAAPRHAQQAVIEEVAERLAPFTTEAGVRVPFATHVALGRKKTWGRAE